MVRWLSFLLLLGCSAALQAVTNPMVNVDDVEAGATANYDFSFQTSRALSAGDIIVVQTNSSAGPVFSGTTLDEITPTTGSISNRTPTANNITLSGGVANGATVTISLSGVVNPGSPGQGPNYTIRTVVMNPFSILEAQFPGTVYTSSSTPSVSTPIPDQTIFEGDGNQVVINDLNDHFTDGDGDDLTFSIDPGHDTNVVNPSVNGDQLLLDGQAAGSTTVTVRASDLPSGVGEGEVTDSFDVRVIGELDNAMVQVASDQGGATTDYTFTFDLVGDIDTDHLIIIQNELTGSDYSGASLGLLTGGTLSASQFQASTGTYSIQINSGSAVFGDPIQVVLNDVVNPSISGQGPDITIRILNQLAAQDEQMVVLPGIVFGSLFGTPEATNLIDRANLNEADGSVQWVSDLNNHFTDPDGDPLTFTVEPGHDTAVVDVSINGAQLTLDPLMNGNTTVEIKASDLPSGTGEGEAFQSFTVSVLGELASFSVTPDDLEVGAVTDYVVSFVTDDVLDSSDLLALQTTKGGPDFSSVSSGALIVSTGNVNLNVSAVGSDGIGITIDPNAVSAGETVTFTVEDVTNPISSGLASGYSLSQIRPPNVIAVGNAGGNEFINSDVIFASGFDAAASPPAFNKRQAVEVLTESYEFLVPVKDRDQALWD